jgi:hypothetical protein
MRKMSINIARIIAESVLDHPRTASVLMMNTSGTSIIPDVLAGIEAMNVPVQMNVAVTLRMSEASTNTSMHDVNIGMTTDSASTFIKLLRNIPSVADTERSILNRVLGIIL